MRHGVERGAQAEKIGAVIDRLAEGLLGGHVLRRAGNHAALGKAGIVHGAGQAKIGEPDATNAVLQKYVGGLYVAVHQPLGVRRREPGCGLHADAQDLLDFERPIAIQAFLKRPARDIGHDQVGQALPGFDGVDRDNMWMNDRGGRLGFAVKALAGGAAAGEIWGEHLDRHGTIQRRRRKLSKPRPCRHVPERR